MTSILRRKKRSGCKSSAVADSMITLIILVVVGIVILISYNVYTTFNTALQSSDVEPNVAGNKSLSMSAEFDNSFPDWVDGLFMVLLGGLFIATMVFSWYLDNSPIFLFVGIILIIILIVVAALISNSFVAASEGTVIDPATNFPIINWVLNHLVEIGLALSFSSVIILYAKSRVEG